MRVKNFLGIVFCRRFGRIDSARRLIQSRLMSKLICAAVFLSMLTCAHASQRTQVVPYPVTGNTAAAIYQNIKTSSPKVAANATFAFTLPFIKTVKRENSKAGACKYSSFKTSSIFHIVVPKLSGSAKASKSVRAQFRGFSDYLVTHETWHRDNWVACLRDYDQAALKLTARDCKSLDRKRERLFTSIKKRCVAKDEAFDFSFRKDVLKHPFVRDALKKD